MPMRLETESRAGLLTASINVILAADGIPGLTLRRIAQQSGVSPASMLHHLGDRAQLLRVGAHLTGRALRDAISSDRHVRGVAAFLPHDDEDVLLTRAWVAWGELWRTDPEVRSTVTEARRLELSLLAETLEHRLVREDLEELTAVIDGLRMAVTAPSNPMPTARAQSVLRRYAESLLSGRVRAV